jgi:DNA invertase Pin-like site-specific DNA recombinase
LGVRLVGYARTSKDKADGVSHDEQEARIRAWARDHRHEVVDILHDVGVPGTVNGTDRPGLAAALNDIREGRASALVVLRLDRLARKLHVQEAVLQRAWQDGGRVYEVEGGEVLQDDPEDPVRTFVRQVMGAVAELERNMTRKRLHNNRREAARQGRYVGGSRLQRRYGYRLVKGENGKHRFVAVEEEQRVIARMLRMRSAGATLQSIADHLKESGVLTASGASGWTASSVRKVIARETARGQGTPG